MTLVSGGQFGGTREAMLLAPEIAVIVFGGLEQFATAVGCVEMTAISQALHLGEV
jgi:hypothetical protein